MSEKIDKKEKKNKDEQYDDDLEVEFLIDEYYSNCRMCPFRGFCGT